MDTENLSQGVKKTLDNQYLFWSLMLFAVVFGWLARPPIPSWLLKLFENPIFQYLVLFGVVYTGSKDLKAAIWSPLIFMGIMYLLNLFDKKKHKREGFYSDEETEGNNEEGNEDGNEEGNENENENEEGNNENEGNEYEVNENEDFEDKRSRKDQAMEIQVGLSELGTKATQLYSTATSLVDSYNRGSDNSTIGNTTTEGFYDYSSCGCI
jgi:hypothetical protein